ncbi:hypothetical protein B0H16DRAFT_1697832 [Mycena metata]|uniref:Uncharacterized protein n=1 Tax=Mycena metata TaxID=1033252 RepID=A0AAD7MPL4_9AGAR|nr:hypothetical protein B0H16DRAFT_1697832 [Mycena metata]
MGPSPPSRLLLALTLFLTLTQATVTVYTPTQVVFTTTPAVSGTPAAYTGVAAYNPGTLAPPPLPTPAVLTNPIPINLQNSGMPGLGVKQKSRHGRDPQRAHAVEEPDGCQQDDADAPAPNAHWFLGIPWRGGVRGNEMRQPRLAWGLLVILLRRGSGFMHTAIFLHYLARMLRRPLGGKIKGKRRAYLPMSCACASASSPLARQLHPFPVLAFAAASPHAPPPLPVTELRVHMHMMCARRVPRRRRSSCTGAQADSSRACAALSTRNLPPPISALLSTSPSPSPSLPSSLLPFLLQVYTAKHYGILVSKEFGLRDCGGVMQEIKPRKTRIRVRLDSTRGRGRLTRTKSSPDACGAVGGEYIHIIYVGREEIKCSSAAQNVGLPANRFDVEYRGVERGYYGLKNTSNGSLALVMMEFEKPWLKS